ncbi:hypothetical protein AAF712_006529 [Marasmius tenuissimus]|uniref:Uncharacterized protein n=1 Tax=Marasmius tenuissimus TaxID=585030 RepID=A0ABR2ZXN6_9AGAR
MEGNNSLMLACQFSGERDSKGPGDFGSGGGKMDADGDDDAEGDDDDQDQDDDGDEEPIEPPKKQKKSASKSKAKAISTKSTANAKSYTSGSKRKRSRSSSSSRSRTPTPSPSDTHGPPTLPPLGQSYPLPTLLPQHGSYNGPSGSQYHSHSNAQSRSGLSSYPSHSSSGYDSYPNLHHQGHPYQYRPPQHSSHGGPPGYSRNYPPDGGYAPAGGVDPRYRQYDPRHPHSQSSSFNDLLSIFEAMPGHEQSSSSSGLGWPHHQHQRNELYNHGTHGPQYPRGGGPGGTVDWLDFLSGSGANARRSSGHEDQVRDRDLVGAFEGRQSDAQVTSPSRSESEVEGELEDDGSEESEYEPSSALRGRKGKSRRDGKGSSGRNGKKR